MPFNGPKAKVSDNVDEALFSPKILSWTTGFYPDDAGCCRAFKRLIDQEPPVTV